VLHQRWTAEQIERRLLLLAGAFVCTYALALTLAPAARLRTWPADYRWLHWLGVAAWVGMFALAQRALERWLPRRDPYLLPAAALLSGWGLLTVWRLAPEFGLRQSAWLVVALGVFILGLRLPAGLELLRRYKYLWLTSGLLLTATTLVFGSNPLGAGPRLWLGCCGLYFQPSEPLKLLLVVYLAAYLADRWQAGAPTARALPALQPAGSRPPLLALLGPTLIMTGLALLLLVVQRDLGTASIFLFLYAAIIYTATGDRAWCGAALTVTLAGLAGYALFDVVRLRMEAGSTPGSTPAGVLTRSCSRCWLWPTAGCSGAGLAWAAPDWCRWRFRISFLPPSPKKAGWSGRWGCWPCWRCW
jgi:cell division protein FtsW (lipid II flippase)